MRWNETTHIFEQSTNDGASWTILPLNASVINEGAINAARLPGNIAYKDQGNVFTANQVISVNTPRLQMIDPTAPVDARVFETIISSQAFIIRALNDAQSTQQMAIVINRTGNLSAQSLTAGTNIAAGLDYFEKGRATALGTWANQAFNPAHYSSGSGGTWTIGQAAFVTNSYTLIGKLLIWKLYISWFSGSNSLTGSPTTLQITMPGGLVGAGATSMFPIAFLVNGTGATIVGCVGSIAGSTMSIQRADSLAFNVGAIGLVCTVMFEIN